MTSNVAFACQMELSGSKRWPTQISEEASRREIEKQSIYANVQFINKILES